VVRGLLLEITMPFENESVTMSVPRLMW
jgi:hypothetical protein